MNDKDACEYIAEHNCAVKYKVVMKDERESGLREVLNLGHTVGRAIETVSDYKLLHGEAVSIGLIAQAKRGEKYGYISPENVSRVIKLCERAKLPVAIPDYIDKAALVRKLYTASSEWYSKRKSAMLCALAIMITLSRSPSRRLRKL